MELDRSCGCSLETQASRLWEKKEKIKKASWLRGPQERQLPSFDQPCTGKREKNMFTNVMQKTWNRSALSATVCLVVLVGPEERCAEKGFFLTLI